MKTTLSQLRLVDWLILSTAMSVIGSILMVLIFAAVDIHEAVDPDYSWSNPYFIPNALEQLVYTGLYSLLANVLGALSLMAIFAIRRRIRPAYLRHRIFSRRTA